MDGDGGRDVIVVRGEVVTMDDARRVIADGAVAIGGSTIAAVGTWAEVRAVHRAATVVGDGGGLITPGYVNAHQHLTGDRLIASCIPEDIDSQEAIFGWAVPVHQAHTAADDELSASLAAAAALCNGVTTTLEAGTVAHPDAVATAVERAGMRTLLGRWGWDAPGVPFGAPCDEVIDAQRELLERYPAGGDGLVRGWVSLVGHDLVSDELFCAAAELAGEHRTGLTFHMSPHAGDARAFAAAGKQRPLVHLQRLGVLGRNVVVAHGVHLDADEVDAVLDSGCALAACPWAYLRLAQGVTRAARYAEFVRRGGRIAVGCDAENAGDAPDVLRAAALLVGLCRDQVEDPALLTAADGLAMATIEGARAVGLGELTGSIEVGKAADLVHHDRRGAAFVPRAEGDHGVGGASVRQLVWGSDGRSVTDVWVAGRQVVRAGRCLTVDIDAARAEAQQRQRRLLGERPPR